MQYLYSPTNVTRITRTETFRQCHSMLIRFYLFYFLNLSGSLAVADGIKKRIYLILTLLACLKNRLIAPMWQFLIMHMIVCVYAHSHNISSVIRNPVTSMEESVVQSDRPATLWQLCKWHLMVNRARLFAFVVVLTK